MRGSLPRFLQIWPRQAGNVHPAASSTSTTMVVFAHCGGPPAGTVSWRPSHRPQSCRPLKCRAATSDPGSPSTSGRSAPQSQRGSMGPAKMAAVAAAGLAGAVVGASTVSALLAPGHAGAAVQAIGEGSRSSRILPLGPCCRGPTSKHPHGQGYLQFFH